MKKCLTVLLVFVVVVLLGIGGVSAQGKRKPNNRPDALPRTSPSFSDLDKDQDGKLTLEEYKAGFPDAKDVEKEFKSLDTNGDGTLSIDEYKAGHPDPAVQPKAKKQVKGKKQAQGKGKGNAQGNKSAPAAVIGTVKAVDAVAGTVTVTVTTKKGSNDKTFTVADATPVVVTNADATIKKLKGKDGLKDPVVKAGASIKIARDAAGGVTAVAVGGTYNTPHKKKKG